MQYILVDDSVSGIGGTALTLEGIIEPVADRATQIPTRSLRMSHVMSNLDKTWIFGNIHGITNSCIQPLISALSLTRFFKIEFDYGYCIYRGRIPHKELGGSTCDCTKNPQAKAYQEIYNLIKHRSSAIFYMSREQMDFHIQDVGIDESKCHILSSCFTRDFYPLVRTLSQVPKNNKFAIIDGQGGWHSIAKGVDKAIKIAKDYKMEYDILKTSSHGELMEKLCRYRGLIFQPIIHDTCPRITIEARLLNLELLINEKCQHVSEPWWDFPSHKMIAYLSNRPNFLWKTIDSYS